MQQPLFLKYTVEYNYNILATSSVMITVLSRFVLSDRHRLLVWHAAAEVDHVLPAVVDFPPSQSASAR